MDTKTACVIALVCSFSVGCAEDSVGQDAIDYNAETGGDGASASDMGTTPAGDDTGTTPTDDTGTTPTGDSTPGTDTGGGGTATSPDCDLNGRWLVSQRIVASAIGQKQASHNWFYFEIKQDGDNVTLTKSLHCGYVVQHLTALGADVSSQPAWPSILSHCSIPGRTGHFKVAGDSCQFDLAKEYVVRGATVSAYRDPSVPLPDSSHQAMGSTPGWEDWEPDGHPGITLSVSGAATGKLYVVQRDWTTYAGTVAKKSTKFMASVQWNAEQSVLGYEGSSLIKQSSTPDSDPTQHFVWMHKLDAGQATGSDSDICAAVRTLKDTLVPEANK